MNAIFHNKIHAHSPTTLTKLFLIAVLLHGPLDIAMTSLAWSLESNPIVLILGFHTWLVVKILTLSVATSVWFDSRLENPEPYPVKAAAWLGVLIGLGIALILPNLLLLSGVFL